MDIGEARVHRHRRIEVVRFKHIKPICQAHANPALINAFNHHKKEAVINDPYR
jgi:hypothetical protein